MLQTATIFRITDFWNAAGTSIQALTHTFQAAELCHSNVDLARDASRKTSTFTPA